MLDGERDGRGRPTPTGPPATCRTPPTRSTRTGGTRTSSTSRTRRCAEALLDLRRRPRGPGLRRGAARDLHRARRARRPRWSACTPGLTVAADGTDHAGHVQYRAQLAAVGGRGRRARAERPAPPVPHATPTRTAAAAATPFGETACAGAACDWAVAAARSSARSTGGADTGVPGQAATTRGDIAPGHFYFADALRARAIPNAGGGVPPGLARRGPAVGRRAQARNDAIEGCQGNRNPFVDRPDFVARLADFLERYQAADQGPTGPSGRRPGTPGRRRAPTSPSSLARTTSAGTAQRRPLALVAAHVAQRARRRQPLLHGRGRPRVRPPAVAAVDPRLERALRVAIGELHQHRQRPPAPAGS
ncbi:MAG: hypothetical protein M0C28_11295 [Candidatus Moduliflexus flocculans]|nr:hypothetical protein [Candidatus Moduliflexus flocculans]